MDIPNVALLCLEQRDRSLETHTRDFWDLACLTHYPDRSLCVFYISSLSEWSKECQFCCMCGVGAGEYWTILLCLPRWWGHLEPHSQIRDQSAVIPLHGATAWTHCRRRAWARCDWADNPHGAWASLIVWPSAWAGNIDCSRGSFGGDQGLGRKPCPHSRDWGWATTGFWELYWGTNGHL